MKGGYIHPKFLRDDKKLCNAIKLRNRASTRTPYKDSFRRAEVPKSATSSNSGCEDELWRPTNMPSEMTQPLTSIMGNRQLINPLFYRQENFALPVVKGKFSPCLDFLEQFTGQQQPEQEYWSSLPVASIIDHSICGPAWDVGMSYHPRLLTPTDARSNEQDFSNQSHTISFVGYERTFYEPLTDDLEPKQFPPRNFIMTGSRMIDLEVSNRLLPSPGVMGHGTCFDMELTNDIPSMCNNMSKASLYLDSF